MARKLNKTAIILTVLMAGGTRSLSAEDTASGSSQPFFPQNYVNTDQNSKKPEIPAQRNTQKSDQATARSMSGENKDGLDNNSVVNQQKDNSQDRKEVELGEQAIDVETVGAIISSKDPQHLKDMLQELLDVAVKYDFALGDIYTVGFPPDSQALKPLLIKLSAREGKIMARAEVPEKYQVSKSPTWIVSTAAGEILLEGTGPLGANFNSKGKFLNRYQELDEPR